MGGKIKWAAVIAAVAIVAFGAALLGRNLLEKRAQEQAESAARAVRTLPPGVVDAWGAYVDRRIAATISLKDGAIHLTEGKGPAGPVSSLPDNTPFEVDCDTLAGGAVRFGEEGQAGIAAPIFGSVVTDQTAEKPPPLGVNPASVAASMLSSTLCERILIDVQSIVKPGAGSDPDTILKALGQAH
jgi:hypothetical protein